MEAAAAAGQGEPFPPGKRHWAQQLPPPVQCVVAPLVSAMKEVLGAEDSDIQSDDELPLSAVVAGTEVAMEAEKVVAEEGGVDNGAFEPEVQEFEVPASPVPEELPVEAAGGDLKGVRQMLNGRVGGQQQQHKEQHVDEQQKQQHQQVDEQQQQQHQQVDEQQQQQQQPPPPAPPQQQQVEEQQPEREPKREKQENPRTPPEMEQQQQLQQQQQQQQQLEAEDPEKQRQKQEADQQTEEEEQQKKPKQAEKEERHRPILKQTCRGSPSMQNGRFTVIREDADDTKDGVPAGEAATALGVAPGIPPGDSPQEPRRMPFDTTVTTAELQYHPDPNNASTPVSGGSPRPGKDEGKGEGKGEGAARVHRRPTRVSFSEAPPLRAVYAAFDNEKSGTAKADAGASSYPPGEKWRILRNVTLMSASFMVLFTAFFGAANLQSSVNAEAGLGTASLTAVYAALIVSNLFLPSVVIKWFGCKWTVALGALLFTPYAAAQLTASWSSLVPSALLLGAAGAPMWCAKCSYLNAAAGAFAEVTGAPRDLVMVRFFGLFYVLFPLGHVWGNLITSGVLSAAMADEAGSSANATLAVPLETCGAAFCRAEPSVELNPNLARPPDDQIRTIGALFIALTLLAVIIVAFGVDNLRRYGEGSEGAVADPHGGSPVPAGGSSLLVATLRLLADRNQLLLVPITAFIGVSQAFLGADFTEGYIACAWGIKHIGYVLVGYGLASSLASVAVSWVVKRAGRLIVIACSIGLFLALVAVLRWWAPRPDQGFAFVLLTLAWGLADSTALVINAMYGLLFRGREAAAYSNFSLWGSAGFIVTYSYSPRLCMTTKLAILAGILIASIAGFTVAELALRRVLEEEEAQKRREEILAGAGVIVLNDKSLVA